MTLWLIPGLYDSGHDHWQRIWQRDHGARVIEQRDWQTPHLADWVTTIEAALDGDDGGPVVLAAHSLGCVTAVRWAAGTRHAGRVRGALLVAPSDTEAPSYPPGTVGFRPVPEDRLPFPSLVVATTDDIYVSVERARRFAGWWGSDLEVIGAAGHINTASGHGPWPEGYAFLGRWLG